MERMALRQVVEVVVEVVVVVECRSQTGTGSGVVEEGSWSRQ
jgi:hypothetical protein